MNFINQSILYSLILFAWSFFLLLFKAEATHEVKWSSMMLFSTALRAALIALVCCKISMQYLLFSIILITPRTWPSTRLKRCNWLVWLGGVGILTYYIYPVWVFVNSIWLIQQLILQLRPLPLTPSHSRWSGSTPPRNRRQRSSKDRAPPASKAG